MTINDLSARLTTIHDSAVVFVLERVTEREVLYLSNNLRECLTLHSAAIASHRGVGELCIVRRNSSQVRAVITDIHNCAEVLHGWPPGTKLFTFSRTGIYESQI